jgi:glycerol-3-phosphate acyltransferase PlsY
MFAVLLFLFLITVAYLIGSVCSAVIVCRIFDLPDPRSEGSKNPGATNVLRLSGKHYAIIVLLSDVLKGFLPVVLAKLLGAGPIFVGFTCLAAVIGHMYPLFFEFKGGKGVATAMGALLGFHFMLGVMVVATWLIIANFTRYSSLASILSMMLAPFYSLFAVGNVDAFLPLSFIAIAVIYKHRENFARLVDGIEPKINFQTIVLNDNLPEAIPKAKKTATKPLSKKTTATKKTTTQTTKKPKESLPKATTKIKTEKPATKKKSVNTKTIAKKTTT